MHSKIQRINEAKSLQNNKNNAELVNSIKFYSWIDML